MTDTKTRAPKGSIEQFLPHVPDNPPTAPPARRTRSSVSRRKSRPMQTMETPRQRFLRIAGHRMTAVLREIRLVGNCAGPGYEYTQDDVARMSGVIHEAVDQAFSRYEKGASTTKLENTFSLEG